MRVTPNKSDTKFLKADVAAMEALANDEVENCDEKHDIIGARSTKLTWFFFSMWSVTLVSWLFGSIFFQTYPSLNFPFFR